MPTARRIIFGTYVVPTQSDTMEEPAITQTTFQTSPAGTIGGKGSATINATQWSDSWTSMERPEQEWEDLDSKWEVAYSLWNVNSSGDATITDSSIATLSDDGSDLAFLYVKNTGATYNALVALDGGTNYYIIIPPGGSVHLRGDGTQLLCNEVRVKASNSAGTTIEFIIAKE
jgi:hypothetical protein